MELCTAAASSRLGCTPAAQRHPCRPMGDFLSNQAEPAARAGSKTNGASAAPVQTTITLGSVIEKVQNKKGRFTLSEAPPSAVPGLRRAAAEDESEKAADGSVAQLNWWQAVNVRLMCDF